MPLVVSFPMFLAMLFAMLLVVLLVVLFMAPPVSWFVVPCVPIVLDMHLATNPAGIY